MSAANEFTQLVRSESTSKTGVMPSLYSLCLDNIKQSRRWEHCILSVPVSNVKIDLLTSDMHINPIICIATHYQGSDGEIAVGSNCGYHVINEVFVVGSFEAHVFSEPCDQTKWFYSLSVGQVVDGNFENNVINLLNAANGSVDEKRARLCMRSINEWFDKHKDCLQKACLM